jgi:hypothetical protein
MNEDSEQLQRLRHGNLVEHYRCASCWGLLVERYIEGQGWIVECASAGQEHAGFVTASFVNHRRAVSHLEAAEVSGIYAAALGLQRCSIADASQSLYGSDETL